MNNRSKRIAATTALILVLAPMLSGCLFPLNRPGEVKKPITIEETAAAPVEEAPVEEASGTFQNPYPAGSEIETTTYDGVVYGTVITVAEWDAWGTVQAANRFNSAPPAGKKYMLANVTVTAYGDAPVNPSVAAWGITFLDPNTGQASSSASVVVPRLYYDVAEIYPGGSLVFDLVFEVDIATVSGIWVFGSGSAAAYVNAV